MSMSELVLNDFKVTLPYFDNFSVFGTINSSSTPVLVIKPPLIEYMGDKLENRADPFWNKIKHISGTSREVIFIEWLYNSIEYQYEGIGEAPSPDDNMIESYHLQKSLYNPNVTLKSIFVDRHIVKTEDDLNSIYYTSFLTEPDVLQIMESMQITRNGRDILNYPLPPLKERIEVEPFVLGQMHLVHPIEIQTLLEAHGMSIYDWNKMDKYSKMTLLATYRLNVLKEAHVRDIQNKENK